MAEPHENNGSQSPVQPMSLRVTAYSVLAFVFVAAALASMIYTELGPVQPISLTAYRVLAFVLVATALPSMIYTYSAIGLTSQDWCLAVVITLLISLMSRKSEPSMLHWLFHRDYSAERFYCMRFLIRCLLITVCLKLITICLPTLKLYVDAVMDDPWIIVFCFIGGVIYHLYLLPVNMRREVFCELRGLFCDSVWLDVRMAYLRIFPIIAMLFDGAKQSLTHC